MVTLVVPAAGRGSRLPGVLPKALVELDGRSLIDWVLSAASGLVDRLVVVVRPEEGQAFEAWASTAVLPADVSWAFQQVPDGSLSAVRIGVRRALEVLARSGIVVIWADQVGVGADTIRAVANAIATEDKVLAVPLCQASSPYVWVEIGDRQHIQRVRRTRDGDISPPVGLSDLGVFGLSGSLARAFIELDEQVTSTDSTRESDFTYLLPRLSLLSDRTFTPLVTNHRELIAVNTADDLKRARDALR